MSYYGLGQFKGATERLQPVAVAKPGNTELSFLLANCYPWSGPPHIANFSMKF